MVKRLRVLFVVPSLGQGGAETQLINLVNGLSDSKFEKHVVCFESDLRQLEELDQSTTMFHHVPRQWKYDRTLAPRLGQLINQLSIDVVHATLLIGAHYAAGAIRAARKTSRRSPRFVIAIHSTKSRTLKMELIYRTLFQRALRMADQIIFVSDAQRNYWLNKYPWMTDSSVTIHNGINTDDFVREPHRAAGLVLRKQLNIDDSIPVISCIAAFRVEKNHSMLLQAVSEVNDRCVLCLAGDGGGMAEAQQQVAELQIQDKVRFLGRLRDVRPLLAVSDFTVMASRSEAFSMTMLESLAMQVPMLSTDVGGMGEAITSGLTGQLIPANDINALRDAIGEMLSDAEKLQMMGERGAQLVREEFTQKHMMQKISLVLRGVAPNTD